MVRYARPNKMGTKARGMIEVMGEFIEFREIPRLSRKIIITEKIDGTNAQIKINEDGSMLIGSRSRWITPEDDNYGFAKWCEQNKGELMKLGIGSHFGEWWGHGIQRNYYQTRKRFSLFNTSKWLDDSVRPSCCDVVPILYQGLFDEYGVMKGMKSALAQLAKGSVAAPGCMKPEGIVIYNVAANVYFKKTLEKDDEYKGKAQLKSSDDRME